MNKFLEEIQEQPQALNDTLQYYTSSKGRSELDKVKSDWLSGKYDKIVVTGMGSSYFVAYALASMLCNYHIPAFSINAGELLHFQHPVLNSSTLLICISQSGESYEVVKLVNTISSNITIVTISNEEDSFLARHSAYTLLSKAGKEDMTSTKTFICTYLVSYLLCNTISQIAINYSVLYKLVVRVEETLLSMTCVNESSNCFIEKALDIFQNTSFVQLIARGTDFTTVSQSALMFMEATKTPASAMLGGEFRHGPLEMVGDNFTSIVIGNLASGTYSQMERLVMDILAYGGKVILITDCPVDIQSPNLLSLHIPNEESDLFVIPSIIPIQLLVNAFAEKKNIIPGNFLHGSKITAKE